MNVNMVHSMAKCGDMSQMENTGVAPLAAPIFGAVVLPLWWRIVSNAVTP